MVLVTLPWGVFTVSEDSITETIADCPYCKADGPVDDCSYNEFSIELRMLSYTVYTENYARVRGGSIFIDSCEVRRDYEDDKDDEDHYGDYDDYSILDAEDNRSVEFDRPTERNLGTYDGP